MFASVLFLIGGLLIMIVPSLAGVSVIQQRRKKSFSLAECITVFLGCLLFGVPLFLILLLAYIPGVFLGIPLGLTVVLSLVILYRNGLVGITMEKQDYGVMLLFLAFIGLIWFITHVYVPLPDYDPYTWIARYTDFLAAYKSGVFAPPSRAGFFGILFLYNTMLGIGLDTLMKHGLPLLYATVAFPVWMVAKKTTSSWVGRIAILTLPLWSASTILYATTSMPQTFFIIAMIFAVMCIAYSRIRNEKFYYYFAGFILFACLPVYEVSAIPFYIWLAVTCWNLRKNIAAYLRTRFTVLSLALLVALIATNISRFHQPLFFLQIWISRIYNQIFSGSINLKFPVEYTNVDGNSVGWDGPWGALEYYAYYVGAPVIIVICVAVVLVIVSYRRAQRKKYRVSVEAQVVLCTFLAFFVLSEIFPRIINLAILPERAWIFGGICMGYALTLIFWKASPKMLNVLGVIIIIAVVPSIGAALFINNEKKFFIPVYQVESAKWITTHLPKQRIVISDENANLLNYYGQSKTVTLPGMYCNDSFGDSSTLISSAENVIDKDKKGQTIQAMVSDIRQYAINASQINSDIIASISKKYIPLIDTVHTTASEYHYYIYYGAEDPRNPYLHRPYAKERTSCDAFVFDQHPETYQRIYEDGNRVIIWQVR